VNHKSTSHRRWEKRRCCWPRARAGPGGEPTAAAKCPVAMSIQRVSAYNVEKNNMETITPK
jgi:hypothetical protein